jgi:exopolysaccharide biosynthesis polyprenyl glycosylphosphotransferase
LTLTVRYGWNDGWLAWNRHFWPFTLTFIFWIVIMFINDFYELKVSYNTTNLINGLTKVFVINGALAVLAFYFLTPLLDTIKPQRVLIIDLFFSLALLFFWRKIFYNFIKSPAIRNRLIVVGESPLNQALIDEINRRPQLGFEAIANPDGYDDLKIFCQEKQIDILVTADNLKNNNELAKKVFDCLSLGVDVYNINSFYEHITNRIPVEYIEHSWFLENLTEHSKKFYELTKRIIDLILAGLGLVAAVPLFPLIAIIIKLETPGPIIFKQIRLGRNGKEFLAMKFRSMISDAEKNGPQWAQKNDPRVTRFGSLMRKTRLDEIPQLINVLRGEMSFVGPRPERPEFIKILSEEIPFYKERLLVRPGLTGWAQLNGPAYGGSREESLEKVKYDLYYIKNRSLLLDLNIMLKTIKVALSGRGQ